jgi:archaellum biogenesis ATPase FlaH
VNQHLALLPDDEPPGGPLEDDRPTITPSELAQVQAYDARAFMERVRAGGSLRFPWTDLDKMVGPMLPGWLIVVGGRAKAGKTTMLMELMAAWTEMRKTVVYVGTETSVALLRYIWAAVRCNVPVETAIDPACPQDVYDRIMVDVEVTQARPEVADFAIFADASHATVSELALWAGYGKMHGADALIFDHFSRLEVGQGERWQGLGQAIRQIKKLAVEADMTLVVGAQLTQIQRECDVGVQLWRPFKPGITGKQKQEAKEDHTKVSDLIQPGVMGVRLAAHRWGKAPNQFCKLVVADGQISGYSGRVL